MSPFSKSWYEKTIGRIKHYENCFWFMFDKKPIFDEGFLLTGQI